MSTPCTTCDEGCGYLWDSVQPCPDCDKGKAIAHQADLLQAEYLRDRLDKVNQRIQAYRPPQSGRQPARCEP